MKIGILGGTFNPIHIGHLIIAEEVYIARSLSKIIFIPVNKPPHKNANNLVDSTHRYQMISEAIKGVDHFEVSDIEIKREGKSFTIDTIMSLRNQYGPDSELYLIIGGDSLSELNTWKDVKLLSDMCKFIVVNRPEYDTNCAKNLKNVLEPGLLSALVDDMVEIPPIGISSTAIRKRLVNRGSIRFWTPTKVEDYIEKHRLYLS